MVKLNHCMLHLKLFIRVVQSIVYNDSVVFCVFVFLFFNLCWFEIKGWRHPLPARDLLANC